MKRFVVAASLMLSLGSLAYAAEPAKAPADSGAPAASAPAAQAAPVDKKSIKANKTITIGMFLVIIAITMSVVVLVRLAAQTTTDMVMPMMTRNMPIVIVLFALIDFFSVGAAGAAAAGAAGVAAGAAIAGAA